jgi:hypothetical protein
MLLWERPFSKTKPRSLFDKAQEKEQRTPRKLEMALRREGKDRTIKNDLTESTTPRGIHRKITKKH